MSWSLVFGLVLIFAMGVAIYYHIRCLIVLRKLMAVLVSIDTDFIKNSIASIAALDPGKIYVISVDLSVIGMYDMVENLMHAGMEYDLRFLFLDKNTTEFISTSEGIAVDTTSLKAYQLMEKEMIFYLEKTYPKDDVPISLLVTELARIFRANKEFEVSRSRSFSDPSKWPEEVTEEQMLFIIGKWKSYS